MNKQELKEKVIPPTGDYLQGVEAELVKNPYDVDEVSKLENRKDLYIINEPPGNIQDSQVDLQDSPEKVRLQEQFDTYQVDEVQEVNKNSLSFQKIDFNEEQDKEEEDDRPFFVPKSFYDGFSIVSQTLFLHIFSFMIKINDKVINKGEKIKIEHLPPLTQSERIETVFEQAEKHYMQIRLTKPRISRWDLTKVVFFGVLSKFTILIVLFSLLECIGKCLISIFMSYLISSMIDQDLNNAYIYGSVIALLQLLTLIGRHNTYYYSLQFSIEARMILINLVYKKLTLLNAFSIKEANVGKIINLISGDLSLLEYHFVLIFTAAILPVAMIFCCAILWVRFGGPIGLLAATILMAIYPFQLFIQNMASKQIMQSKRYGDQRMKLTNELIEGVRLIKMYAWEDAFKQLISVCRSSELRSYALTLFCLATDRSVNFFAQIWASLIFFIAVHYGGFTVLTPNNMISTIQLLSYMKSSCVFLISYALSGFLNIRISFGRMIDILELNSFDMKNIGEEQIAIKDQTPGLDTPIVQMTNFSSYWTGNVTKDDQPVLKNIDVTIYPGELIALIGKIGSGKSTFLNCLIMEVPLYKGGFEINGKNASEGFKDISVAYVEQEPFIFPDSIRKNILFGRPLNQELYELVIHVANMTDDIAMMAQGDQTQIGERGINLSGGQRARLSLARALYQMADLYIFDDPLSAVDAKVARSIFDNAIKGFIFEAQPKLSGKQRKPAVVLATHQVQFGLECSKILVLDQGRLVAQGSYDDVKEHLNMVGEDFQKIQASKQKEVRKIVKFRRPLSTVVSPMKIERDKKKAQLYKREDDDQSKVTFSTYKRFFKNWPPFVFPFIVIQCMGSEVIYNLFLRYISTYNDFVNPGQQFLVMGILCIVVYFNNYLKYTLNIFGILKSNQLLHSDMLSKLTLSPVSFFDTNPSGRILNRFSTDLSLGDNEVVKMMWDIEELLCFFLISLITIIILEPWFAFAFVVTVAANIWLLKISKSVISQAKECDLIQRSPLFDLFKKTLSGVVQVRLYNQQQWFRQSFFALSNKCIQSNISFYYFQRTFGFNIDFVGQIASIFGIYLIIGLSGSDSGIFVQALLLLLTFNDVQQWCLRQCIQFDSSMNCYNRMFQIADLATEAPHHQNIDQTLKKDWPSKGEVKFKNVYMRYRKDTDLILKDMNFSIKAGEKVGCVGRTGAGKSSILQVIFRMAEVEQDTNSTVEIDGQDIGKLGLEFLRSSIGIIPQTPFVFSGTIRRNLDPLEYYSDDNLWDVLKETNLYDTVMKMKNGLETDMTDVSSVFSVGEKQLICLARTILSNKKIIVLDEATANVDMKTDEFIQNKIREKFEGCTIITIAHRINTIADYDKVLVIDAGKVLEQGSPFELLCSRQDGDYVIDRDTTFATLVKQTGPENAQIILKMAREKQQSVNK